MEQSEKLLDRGPKVLHGPHRLLMSGVAGQPTFTEGTVSPTVAAGESEIAAEVVEIPVELVLLEEPK